VKLNLLRTKPTVPSSANQTANGMSTSARLIIILTALVVLLVPVSVTPSEVKTAARKTIGWHVQCSPYALKSRVIKRYEDSDAIYLIIQSPCIEA